MIANKLVVERMGTRVILTLALESEYMAIEAYEKLLLQGRSGFVLLKLLPGREETTKESDRRTDGSHRSSG